MLVRIPPMEFLVVHQLSVGKTRKQISTALGLSMNGLPHHERKLYERLGARTQAHAVALAYEAGILQISRTGKSESDLHAELLLNIRKEKAARK